jgi:CheY-like chemotaxis protein
MTSPGPGASILIVDDEPELASLLAEILAEDDHRVETAYNGVAPLDKLRDGTYHPPPCLQADRRLAHAGAWAQTAKAEVQIFPINPRDKLTF